MDMDKKSDFKEADEHSGGLKIMVAVDNSPESKAALCWAVENLIAKEDWVLIYHIVKPVPNARGRVSHLPGSPASESNYNSALNQEATRFLLNMEAYCHEKKIFPRMEVGGCVRRQTGIINKVRAEGITHVVMGAKKGSMFELKSWGLRRSLTARVCEEVDCHVTLVDKDKHPTFPKEKAPRKDLRARSASLSTLESAERFQLRQALSEIAAKQTRRTDSEKRDRRYMSRNQGGRRHSFTASSTRHPAPSMSATNGRLKSARDFYAPSAAQKASLFVLEGDEDELEAEEEVFADKFMQRKEPQSVPVAPVIQKENSQRVVTFEDAEADETAAKSPAGDVISAKSVGSPLRSFAYRGSSPSRWFSKSKALPKGDPLSPVEPEMTALDSAQESVSKKDGGLPSFEEDLKISQEAVITALWEQVEKLKQINVLRDVEIEKVAYRAHLAEKEALERERALVKQSRELAELRAEKLHKEVAAFRETEIPKQLEARRVELSPEGDHEPSRRAEAFPEPFNDWSPLVGGALWTISEAEGE